MNFHLSLITAHLMKCLIALCCICSISISNQAEATDYQTLLDQALDICEEINSNKYQTGLWLNPEGYRSYYEKSACIQRAAIAFRALPLCNKVKRRFALFSSSWGYSKANCLDLAAKAEEKDRLELQALHQRYAAGPVQLIELRLEPNGNGRDFDFIPRFSDGFEHGYQLELWLADNNHKRHLILKHGSYLHGSRDNIRLYLPRTDLLDRFPTFQPGRPYVLESRLILSVGLGGPGGWLRDSLLEEVFPESLRTQTLISTVEF